MKLRSLLLVGALVLALPSLALAIGLTASATVSSGNALGPHVLLKCTGYSYNNAGDPWAQCTNLSTGTTLDFGSLDTRLRNSAGADIGGAGCFYATYFYIVYLFPDTWGAAGYQLTQTTSASPAIQNALVFAPVYSTSDMYSGGTAQGPLDAVTYGELLGTPQLATSVGGLILKSKRARIVRAQYGIPPFPGTGDTRPTGWTAIPLTTTGGSYSATITITLGPYV